MRDNDWLDLFEKTIADNGGEVLVQVNDDIVFADRDGSGKEYRLSLLFLAYTPSGFYERTEDTPERLRRLADAYERMKKSRSGAA